MAITTKVGDKGTTTFKNQTIAKDSEKMEFIGTLDELTAHLVYLGSLKDQEIWQARVKELSELAAFICGYAESFNNQYIKDLEKTILEKEESFKFKYPFDDTYKAQVNIARTVARRLERRYIALAKNELDYDICAYLNRLSDYIYIFM